MPTESRNKSAGTGVPAPSIEARCSMRLSTPPSEVARFQISTRAAVAIAASSPPVTRIDTIPPNPPGHLPCRDRVAGMARQTGIEHLPDMGMPSHCLGDELRRAAGALDAQM